MTNTPSEWFKSGKSHQFEGRHEEAIQYFERCLASDWRVELIVKELYNSLVKTKNFQRALEVLQHYSGQIQQKEWLRRELLNTNKKLERTDAVRQAYLHAIKKAIVDFNLHEITQLCNEMALYYYRLGLAVAFESLCESMEAEGHFRPLVPLLRAKWLLHLVKDIKHVVRYLQKHNKTSAIGSESFISVEAVMQALQKNDDYPHLHAMVTDNALTHVYALSDVITYRLTESCQLMKNECESLYHLASKDGLIIFKRLMELDMPEWVLPYIIALGKSLLGEAEVRAQLQALAEALVQRHKMGLLDMLISGVPDLYVLDQEREAYHQALYAGDQSEPLGPVVRDFQLPQWSKSESEYLEKVLDCLSERIEKGLRYIKGQVISDIKHYRMPELETLELLWRLRRYYLGNAKGDAMLWLKYIVDLLIKDIQNVALWLELPLVITDLIKHRQVSPHLGQKLSNVAINAYLHGLYALEKKADSCLEPVRANIEDDFQRVDLGTLWLRFVQLVALSRYEGLHVNLWDSVYGHLQCSRWLTVLPEQWEEQVSSEIFALSYDLVVLNDYAESKRYARYQYSDANVNEGYAYLFSRLLSGFGSEVALALLPKATFAYPIEALSVKLAIMSCLCYEDQKPCKDLICYDIQGLCEESKDVALQGIYELLVSAQADLLGKEGYLLINHALIQLQLGKTLDNQLVNRVKIDYLERVALDEGLAVFMRLSTLDPTNLVLKFQIVDLLVCSQDYVRARAAILDWISSYKAFPASYSGLSQYYEMICYQWVWLEETLEGPSSAEDMNLSETAIAIQNAIVSIKTELGNNDLLFLRTILIHKDIELLLELLKQQSDQKMLYSNTVLKLLHEIFGSDFRVLVLALWQDQALMPFVLAYTQMLKETTPHLAFHFEAIKSQYRREYGTFNTWIGFHHGQVDLYEHAWLANIEASIQEHQKAFFTWLLHLWAFIKTPEHTATLVAQQLEAFRFTKWSQDGYWSEAYKVLPYGRVAYEMGKEALRQGRYESALSCFKEVQIQEISDVILSNADLSLLTVGNNADVLDATIAHFVLPSTVKNFHEGLLASVPRIKLQTFYMSVFQYATSTAFGKGLAETIRLALMKANVEEAIVAWYAFEQKQLGHDVLANKLLHLP